MATRCDDPEDWENIEPHDLRSREPETVARIISLLQVARGHPGENRESPRRKRAMALLRGLVMPTIRACCRTRIWGDYRQDAEAVAEMIFASHSSGTPFLANEPYRTWAESWNPGKGAFSVFVAICANSRCVDWLRSKESERQLEAANVPLLDGEHQQRPSATMAEGEMTPEAKAEHDQMFKQLSLALAELAPCRSTDAIRARLELGLSVEEYTTREGISLSAASMRMTRGGEKLVQKLRESGVVDEGFGLNRIQRNPDQGER
jgi:DNA-directed RNA polymerase specialized sigma24 family protein